jgi:hypothetical protein
MLSNILHLCANCQPGAQTGENGPYSGVDPFRRQPIRPAQLSGCTPHLRGFPGSSVATLCHTVRAAHARYRGTPTRAYLSTRPRTPGRAGVRARKGVMTWAGVEPVGQPCRRQALDAGEDQGAGQRKT